MEDEEMKERLNAVRKRYFYKLCFVWRVERLR